MAWHLFGARASATIIMVQAGGGIWEVPQHNVNDGDVSQPFVSSSNKSLYHCKFLDDVFVFMMTDPQYHLCLKLDYGSAPPMWSFHLISNTKYATTYGTFFQYLKMKYRKNSFWEFLRCSETPPSLWSPKCNSFNPLLSAGDVWVCTQHCSYRCPGAKAPGHQYPQCWLSIHCIRLVLYRNITLIRNNIRNKNHILKKYPVV